MQKELIILDEDKHWARERIAELEAEIQALGPEFYDVFNQSSETWHDNAPFDALRDRQSVLAAELQQLKSTLADSLPSVPHQKRGVIGIGSLVTLRNKKGHLKRYKIAGDWTPHAGKSQDDTIVISAQSPLGIELIGQKIGFECRFGRVIDGGDSLRDLA